MHSAKSAPDAIVAAKGYKLIITKSKGAISKSAFGGVVAANREVSLAMASQLAEIFTEVVIAPSYEAGAIELLSKKPSIRILQCELSNISRVEMRPVTGGVLLHDSRGVCRQRMSANLGHRQLILCQVLE